MIFGSVGAISPATNQIGACNALLLVVGFHVEETGYAVFGGFLIVVRACVGSLFVLSGLLFLAVDVPVDIEGSVLFFLLLLHILVFQSIRINSHLIINNIDIPLPALLVLMQVVEELLVIGIGLAGFLLLLIVVGKVILGMLLPCGSLGIITTSLHPESPPQPITIYDLAVTLLALLAVVEAASCALASARRSLDSLLDVPFLESYVLFAPPFFLEALVYELAELQEGASDEIGVFNHLFLGVCGDVAHVCAAGVAETVVNLGEAAIEGVLVLRCVLRIVVVIGVEGF